MKPHDRIALIIAIGGLVSSAAIGAFMFGVLNLLAPMLLLSVPYLILALWSRHKLSMAKDLQCESRKAASAFAAVLGSSLPLLGLRWSGHSVGDAFGIIALLLAFLLCTPLAICWGWKTEPIVTWGAIRCFGTTRDQEPRPIPTFTAIFVVNSVGFIIVEVAMFYLATFLILGALNRG
jgi:hypothetical protein